MIKFFRHIRQRLLSQYKFSKYLMYAIGEIVLVVIGILIALQINTWNESRKAVKQETQVLTELRSDMRQTRNDIQETIAKHKEVITSNQQLVFDIAKKKPYSDTIYRLFTDSSADFQVIPKTSAFENLKTIGLNTLSNDSLRISITNLYQLNLKRLENDFGMNNSSFNIREQLFPFQNIYLAPDYNDPTKYGFTNSDSITIYKLKIKEYDEFLKDDDLLKTLQLTLWGRSYLVNKRIKTVEEIDKVINRIEEELGARKN